MQLWFQHIIGCSVSSAVGVSANIIGKRCLGREWQRDIAGSPRYSWWQGAFAAGLIFPSLLCADVWANDYSFSDWLRISWSDASIWHGLLHYSLFGFWMKDFFIPMTMLLYAHHVVCCIMILVSFLEPLPASAVFILDVVVLEFGSLANNWLQRYPESVVINEGALVVMTISNMLASGLAIWFITYFGPHDIGSISLRTLLASVACVMALVRQKEMMSHCAAQRLRFRNKAV